MSDSLRALVGALCLVAVMPAAADSAIRADSHAPIGVMADHFHHAGEWMLSYRYMSMSMDGNRQGDDRLSPETIVTDEPNRFFGEPMQPPTLRVVPLDMQMDMHMFGLMFAPSDRVTLMAMVNYLDLEMEHRTYAGAAGTTVLGNFTTTSSGVGDTSVAALVSLLDTAARRLHLIAGLSLPTGSTDESGRILTPMNTRPTVRLPYPMQLGSGSLDPILGLSYAATRERLSWGGQWRSVLRLADNDDDYRLGNEHRLTGWLSWLWRDTVSSSLRVAHYRRDNVSGLDPLIAGPVQTADPDRQAVRRTELGVGINVAPGGRPQGRLRGLRLALEYLVPLGQDLDGPQLETDSSVVFGLQYSW